MSQQSNHDAFEDTPRYSNSPLFPENSPEGHKSPQTTAVATLEPLAW